MSETAGSELKPGDRVFCEMPKAHKGYFIRSEGEFAYLVWDDGSRGSIRKTFVFKTGEEVPPIVRQLCASLELSMRCEEFGIRDNRRLEGENQILAAELDVCAEMVMDLMAGKEVTYELEVGEKKTLKLPLSPREKPLDSQYTWDQCMFRGAVRKKAEKLLRVRDIEEYEKEMIGEALDKEEEDES